MARREVYIGSIGPLLYDDKGGTIPAIRTNGRVQSEEEDTAKLVVSSDPPSGVRPENTLWVQVEDA